MIDPREIMAGNWVIKITGTDVNTKSFFEYKAIAFDEYYYTFARVCFPIKISPLILAKCGFKQESGDWYLNLPIEGTDGRLPFLRFRHADSCWYLEERKLWSQPLYLHQLQNLYYSLSKRELDIHLGRFENTAMSEPIDFFVKPIDADTRVRELI